MLQVEPGGSLVISTGGSLTIGGASSLCDREERVPTVTIRSPTCGNENVDEGEECDSSSQTWMTYCDENCAWTLPKFVLLGHVARAPEVGWGDTQVLFEPMLGNASGIHFGWKVAFGSACCRGFSATRPAHFAVFYVPRSSGLLHSHTGPIAIFSPIVNVFEKSDTGSWTVVAQIHKPTGGVDDCSATTSRAKSANCGPMDCTMGTAYSERIIHVRRIQRTVATRSPIEMLTRLIEN